MDFSDLFEPYGCKLYDCYCSPEIPDQDYDKLNYEEKTYLNKLYQIYHFTANKHDISDWSTKRIGPCLVKTIMEQSWGFDEIDDAFTPLNDNVSWPDVALMYNLKDFRVLTKTGNKLNTPAKYTEPEPCADYDLFCSPGAKGQLISECPFEILDFPKLPRKI